MKLSNHPKIKKDLKSIGYLDQKKIRFAVDEKILVDPFCGKVLDGNLEGSYSFRVGNYRIVYDYLPTDEVYILCIGKRADVYEKSARRKAARPMV